MELKNYQKRVLSDLNTYLDLLVDKHNPSESFKLFWKSKDTTLKDEQIPEYNDSVRRVPHVCFKVPTGGGKTLLAAYSLSPIFRIMPSAKSKVVVWLVPSDAILEQTVRNLKDPEHPYHRVIARDFGGKLEVYTKQQLLDGQNFNPSTVSEQISICILSFDSIRSKNKDGRKVHQDNGNLAQFMPYYKTPETLVKDADITALIQVLNQLNPVVIVDESHHAVSPLSEEMLKNLNPSFILDLTATPKKNSNVLSFVNAIELKNEDMVKLPVIVYNRNSKEDVIINAIDLRHNLELYAAKEQQETGAYIRPIVLFQAQPKGKEDSETFETIRDKLIKLKIPASHIAIKTANKNDIKNIDLLSPDCKIRYIITVNALKEGWDCPFAYILATVANRSSKVDVEQVTGRILRQPYTRKHTNNFLNLAYVLTSSNDFKETLGSILEGLQCAGFSDKDYRVAAVDGTILKPGQASIGEFSQKPEEKLDDCDIDTTYIAQHLPETDIESLAEKIREHPELGSQIIPKRPDYLEKAEEESEKHAAMVSSTSVAGLSSFDPRGNMNPKYRVNEKFRGDVETLRIPQFFLKTKGNIFSTSEEVLLTKEHLSKGFTLRDKATDINFDLSTEDLGKLDVSEGHEATPTWLKLNETEAKYFKDNFAQTPEGAIREAKRQLSESLSRIDNIDDSELKSYLNRIVDSLPPTRVSDLPLSTGIYAERIKRRISELLTTYQEKNFNDMIATGEVICKPSYKLAPEISLTSTSQPIDKSLYVSEGDINGFEYIVINAIAPLENVKWWHRNLSMTEFSINGFVNHYPDFLIMTNGGRLIALETKGEQLAGSTDTMQKIRLGRTWKAKAGDKFDYFMVFKNQLSTEGVYSLPDFINLLKRID